MELVMGQTLRAHLFDVYRADPDGTARFLSDASVLVRVRPRRWKGHRKVAAAKVVADGAEVGEEAVTKPSWKLCPDKMAREFDVLAREVDALLARTCLNPRGASEDDEEQFGTSLVGGGTYAVDAAAWPALEAQLRGYQEKWSAAADRWCAADGVTEIKELLQEQLGEHDFKLVQGLLPDGTALRRKFELKVLRAPVRIVDDTGGDKNLEDARREEVVSQFEHFIRGPREEAAEAWEVFAAQLIDLASGEALRPVRRPKGGVGEAKPGGRTLSGVKVASAGRAARVLAAKAGRYLDGALAALRKDLEVELPAEAGPAGVLARKLNADDAAAVRIGKMCLEAAELARDEAKMCEGFSAARSR